MAKGINIAIGADTRAYADAVKKGMIDPTEQAAEALQDLGRDGGRDLGKLEDGMRDAQRATEDTREEVDDLKKRLRDVGDEAKKSVGDRTRKATDDASKGMEELRDEGTGTAKELAASFDGSAESIGEGFQEVAANAFAGFGPAGAAAGIAAAIGIGAVTAELQAQQERAEELKQLLIDAYKSAAEEGRDFIDQATIDAQALQIFGDAEQRKRRAEDAKKIGADYQTLVRAIAGDVDALALVQEQAAAKEQELNDIYNSTTGAFGDRQEALRDLAPVQALVGELGTLAQTHRDGQTAAEEYEAFVSESAKRERTQIQKTRDADQARYEAAARNRGALAAQPPVVVPVAFSTPDAAAVYNGLQRKLKGFGPVRIDAEVYTRNGTPVY